jgi:hypothetical protein
MDEARLLRFERSDEELVDLPTGRTLLIALDGWTDAGRSGSIAAETLREQWTVEPIGHFDPDGLYDYRDRRPSLDIDRGALGDPVWPELRIDALTAPDGTGVVLVHGPEPDLQWRRLGRELVDLAGRLDIARYIGLGSVPGPIPHTRPPALIITGSDEEVLDRRGRPHERVTVPASCQVVLEAALRDAGYSTLGLWVRIPHYVAGDFPAGAATLLHTVVDDLRTELALDDLEAAAEEHRESLDVAAGSSEEVAEHIRQLERVYDEEVATFGAFGQIPTGEEIAAELERFLRRESGPE